MCLYPRLMYNPKYTRTKKNGGVIPPILDNRVRYVPIGCQKCIECKAQKARGWQVRLLEEIRTAKNGRFVTLTFSNESVQELYEKYEEIQKYEGYDLDNAIATKAVRLFLERWRKKYKVSVRHWLVTELGHVGTEHLHLHGIIWTDKPEEIPKIWKYGYVWNGYDDNKGGIENYVNEKTVNYITKYINKIDEDHPNYEGIVLCSPGIGSQYTTRFDAAKNRYNGTETNETYRTRTGHKIALPTYWRNKIYTEEQREKLWIQKLDKNERWVCGEKTEADNTKEYNNLVEWHRKRTRALGYKDPDWLYSNKAYEEMRRQMNIMKRIGVAGASNTDKATVATLRSTEVTQIDNNAS